MPDFASDGFDLDAVGKDSSEVIFEVGGGATVVPNESEASPSPSAPDAATTPSPIDEAEKWKGLGNNEFKAGNYLEAYDMYTKAVEACPCPLTPKDILLQREEFDKEELKKHRARMDEELKQRKVKKIDPDDSSNGQETQENDKKPSNDEAGGAQKGVPTFQLKPQAYGEKLAIFLNNRAASLIQLQRFEQAISDADVAILLNPNYTKAYLRRATALEKTERNDEALKDLKRASALEPSNGTIRKSVARVQKLEDERLEKLKEETIGKLKDLGNSLLGNFGLSLDNFNTVQDPKTGSYSISFNQNTNANV